MTDEPTHAPSGSEGANDQIPPADELITLKEAAEYSGLSYSYLAQIARSGRLWATRFGNVWVTTQEAVDEYIRSRSKRGFYRKDIEPGSGFDKA